MSPNVIVAIPAKDEAETLGRCLAALREQRDQSGRRLPRGAFGVVVLANNCRDDTADIARHAARGAPFEIRVVEAQLPEGCAHAGGARRAAMDLAEAWLRELAAFDGIILTTDADSRVAPDWISANLRAFAQGADAVLGRICLDEDGERLPPALRARGKLEAVYEDLLTEISARLDPVDYNPWPHHATISGATLGVTRDIYLAVGGLPRVPLGEDKALVAALNLHDARLRYAPDIMVVTSGRIAGRAPGGVADTLRLRSQDPSALCDEALEPCQTAFRRALWRGRARRYGVERPAAALRLPVEVARRVRAASSFGQAWALIEEASPALARRRLAPCELPRQIALASAALRRLQALLAARQDVEPVFTESMGADGFDEMSEARYE